MKTLFLLAMLTLTARGDVWKSPIDDQVRLLGHRNMIIVADAAYPIQTGSGVTVIPIARPHREVVEYVLGKIEASPAVRPLIALDKEFRFVPDARAPGATKLRADILKLVEGKSHEPVREELHETLLGEVNERAADFAVVVLKTEGTIPYSSVFLTLECGYWTAEDEAALRQAMEKAE